MNLKDEKYSRYALVREMLQTPEIISSFNPGAVSGFTDKIKKSKGLFLTGEGSSRIFPAKRAISSLLKKKYSMPVFTDGATQALEYNLDEMAVFLASNSGQTKEVIRLASTLKAKGHNSIYGLTANQGTKLSELASMTHVLSCGKEDAVAATKSVVEQALFYDALLRSLSGDKIGNLKEVGAKSEHALTLKIDPSVTEIIRSAGIIYFAGRNNGVAEELALKTNEITRKKSAYLEGTFPVHGIEEVMDKNEVLIWIDPFRQEIEKFNDCLVKGVGMKIVTVSTEPTMFPTIIIPDAGEFNEYIQLQAGWNILVETGISLGINLDKPTRARKVGNEYIPA
ncbi:MAG TPA: SIS domain-containing protein [Bacteroidales bacterium]|nr:SIS domain-containing protein [Bacteroidales bacterium]